MVWPCEFLVLYTIISRMTLQKNSIVCHSLSLVPRPSTALGDRRPGNEATILPETIISYHTTYHGV